MARKKPVATEKKSGKARASWRGMVRFGLVSFPVEAFNAHSQEGQHIALHQLHAECHSRIQYQKTCPIHGPVKNDEIVSGYEFSKGRYVEIDPDELDSLRSDAERSLTIDSFISPEEIDVVYLDGRMYFLSPDGDQAREPYTVFLEALRHTNRWGVGQVVFSGKEQAVIVRPYQDALHMALLNYESVIRDPAATIAPLIQVRGADKKLRLAEQLIESWTETDFDFSSYKDDYFAKLKTLIEAKVAGREVVTPKVEEEPAVINLMDALKKSIGKGGRARTSTALAQSKSSGRAKSNGQAKANGKKRRRAS